MQIGIGLWCLQSSAIAPRPFPDLYRELRRDARLAEQSGLDSLWLSEHHGFYDGYCPALLPAVASALQSTTTLHVGTGVLLLPLQDPERLSAGALVLNDLYGARFELGMGMGYRPVEFDAKSLSIADRRQRMEHGLECLRERFAERGPAMWVGVTSTAGAKRAGRYGVGLLISGAFSKTVVQQFVDAHRDAWEAAGSPGGSRPPVSALRNRDHVCVHHRCLNSPT